MKPSLNDVATEHLAMPGKSVRVGGKDGGGGILMLRPINKTLYKQWRLEFQCLCERSQINGQLVGTVH